MTPRNKLYDFITVANLIAFCSNFFILFYFIVIMHVLLTGKEHIHEIGIESPCHRYANTRSTNSTDPKSL